MDKIAVVLVGAVTSGKTTLAKQLAAELTFEVINEENTGNYFKIINEIDGRKHPRAVYDHCYLYTQTALFSKEYSEVIICFLNLEDTLLKENYESRKSKDKRQQGDYLKINPIQQRKNLTFEMTEWKKLINLLPNVNLLEIPVNSLSDYKKIKQKLVDSIEKSSQHRS